jgi:hypothetical protein
VDWEEAAESFDFEGVSISSPAGGAESFDGKDLSLFTDFRLVPSPRRGVGFEESFAAWVLGFERVPRTDLLWEASTILAIVMNIMVWFGVELWVKLG